MAILIAVTALLGMILAFYMIFLLKLNQKRPRKHDASPKIRKQRPPIMVGDQNIPEEPTETPQITPTVVIDDKILKKRDAEKKSFYLFGQKDFEGCPHEFEYLKTLPKNTPIPDECFGCHKIIECLGPPSKKKRKSVSRQYYQRR